MNRLEIQGLSVRYGTGSSAMTAVRGVDLAVPVGGTLGLVGESGSGKSSVARAIVGLISETSGQVRLNGESVTGLSGRRLGHLRQKVQMVFQDPYSSLNPRMTVGEVIEEAAMAHRSPGRQERAAEVTRLLQLVGLDPAAAERYPHQFSGGQRQRIAIARALAVEPEVLILDEVTSALDVSVQATILNLLKELQRQLQLSYLFISHNLSVVRYMSDSVAVMYLGRVVEAAPTEALFSAPRHPYTRALIASMPRRVAGEAPAETRLSGEIPDPRFPPSGCPFRTRCPVGPLAHPERNKCAEQVPQALNRPGQHITACHYEGDLA